MSETTSTATTERKRTQQSVANPRRLRLGRDGRPLPLPLPREKERSSDH